MNKMSNFFRAIFFTGMFMSAIFSSTAYGLTIAQAQANVVLAQAGFDLSVTNFNNAVSTFVGDMQSASTILSAGVTGTAKALNTAIPTDFSSTYSRFLAFNALAMTNLTQLSGVNVNTASTYTTIRTNLLVTLTNPVTGISFIQIPNLDAINLITAATTTDASLINFATNNSNILNTLTTDIGLISRTSTTIDAQQAALQLANADLINANNTAVNAAAASYASSPTDAAQKVLDNWTGVPASTTQSTPVFDLQSFINSQWSTLNPGLSALGVPAPNCNDTLGGWIPYDNFGNYSYPTYYYQANLYNVFMAMYGYAWWASVPATQQVNYWSGQGQCNSALATSMNNNLGFYKDSGILQNTNLTLYGIGSANIKGFDYYSYSSVTEGSLGSLDKNNLPVWNYRISRDTSIQKNLNNNFSIAQNNLNTMAIGVLDVFTGLNGINLTFAGAPNMLKKNYPDPVIVRDNTRMNLNLKSSLKVFVPMYSWAYMPNSPYINMPDFTPIGNIPYSDMQAMYTAWQGSKLNLINSPIDSNTGLRLPSINRLCIGC